MACVFIPVSLTARSAQRGPTGIRKWWSWHQKPPG